MCESYEIEKIMIVCERTIPTRTSTRVKFFFFFLSSEFQFSLQEKMRLFSAVAIGAAISPLIIHKLWHLIGSKRIILASNLAMIVSWTLSSFRWISRRYPSKKLTLTFSLSSRICSEYYWCMLIGRGLGGISVGALHLLIPMYINDIANAEQKPLYHNIVQLQFVIGILSQYILSEYWSANSISEFPDWWRRGKPLRWMKCWMSSVGKMRLNLSHSSSSIFQCVRSRDSIRCHYVLQIIAIQTAFAAHFPAIYEYLT